MKLGIGFGLGGNGGGSVNTGPFSAIFLGQSEVEYLFNAGTFYREIAQPSNVPSGNLIVWTQDAVDASPVKTTVNSTTVTAGSVNPAMAAMACWLDHVLPGRNFRVGDGAVAGTSRYDLTDTTTDGTDGRKWSDLTSVVSAIETDTGTPINAVIECWYNADASSITTFKNSFWPLYFGRTGADGAFTLGNTNPSAVNTTAKFDNCLWDGAAATSAKGRGIFARSATLWRVLTPMPFLDAVVSPTPEYTNFSEGSARLSEPARQTMIDLASDTLAQSVGLKVGPSAHVCRFGGVSSTEIHPDVGDKDGQILFMWPFALRLAELAGLTVNEPTISAVTGPSDGSYADVEVLLPNGGTLTTLRTLRAGPSYGGTSPHRQAVTGFEITRAGGARRPVYNTSETSYPADHRGTVTIQDSGSGSPRKGVIRITPTNALRFGDSISYLRGQATASLQEPRDFDLYPDFLIEHVPAWYDSGATYPMEGIAVRPYQAEITCAVPAPAFTARGALFDNTDRYDSSAISVAAGAQGLASFWFRHTGTWTASRMLFEWRVGATQVFHVLTSSSGRLTFRLNQDGTGSDTWVTPTSTFVGDTWYHVLWAWDYANTRFQVYINNVAQTTSAYSFTGGTKFDQSGTNLTRVAVGAAVGGAQQFLGDLGHVFVDFNRTLDLTNSSNRALFASSGAPVNVGSNGQTPFGTAPEYYFDGDGATWANQGTAGNVTLTGALTASSSAPSY